MNSLSKFLFLLFVALFAAAVVKADDIAEFGDEEAEARIPGHGIIGGGGGGLLPIGSPCATDIECTGFCCGAAIFPLSIGSCRECCDDEDCSGFLQKCNNGECSFSLK